MAARKRAKPKAQSKRRPAKRKLASAASSSVRFPGEGVAYRRARDQLLAAERALRRQVEEVAALRRHLPPGGAVPTDYLFDEIARGDGTSAKVKLSELFALPDASLAVYSFMYGPEMPAPCPMCTSILDSLDGAAPHLEQRVNLAVVAKSPLARIRDFARSRGWRNLRLLSSAGNSYNRDYHGETGSGAQMPCLNVFVRRGSSVYHAWASEMLYTKPDSGMGHRHVDMMWPLWNVLDYTREGRGTSWNPQLDYGA